MVNRATIIDDLDERVGVDAKAAGEQIKAHCCG
jgi:hypothetical protein